jgi:hypothetical protein
MAWNGRMIDEGCIGKDFEGSGRGLIVVLSWHFPRETKANYEKHQDSQCPD